jgi:anti-sigma factor RsiW
MTPRRDVHRAVDGELSKEETRKLESNPQAKAELTRLKALADAARDVVRPLPTPTGFKKKVLDRIRNTRPE